MTNGERWEMVNLMAQNGRAFFKVCACQDRPELHVLVDSSCVCLDCLRRQKDPCEQIQSTNLQLTGVR
jgi:hypothetical protein